MALFPNSTHLLQPCDVGVFHPLKIEWKAAVHNFWWKNNGKKLEKENFAPLLSSCLENGVKRSTIINSFKTTGLYPFDPNAINYEKLLKQIVPATNDINTHPPLNTREVENDGNLT